MSEVRARLDADLKEAMRAKEELRLNIVKMLRGALRLAEIDKADHTISDAEVLEIIAREAKKLRDALENFKQGGRPDLVEQTEKEITIIETYLPTPLSDDEVKAIVQEVIAAAGAVTAKDFGRLMKEVVAKAEGRADGGRVSKFVKEALG